MLPAHIGADAITICLRTDRNRLSVWQCDADRGDVGQVALALVAAMRQFEPFHLVLLPRERLVAGGFQFVKTEGRTPIADLRERHLDIAGLHLESLAEFARQTAETVRRFREDIECYWFDAQDLITLLVQAVLGQRLAMDDLQPGIRDAIESTLLSSP